MSLLKFVQMKHKQGVVFGPSFIRSIAPSWSRLKRAKDWAYTAKNVTVVTSDSAKSKVSGTFGQINGFTGARFRLVNWFPFHEQVFSVDYPGVKQGNYSIKGIKTPSDFNDYQSVAEVWVSIVENDKNLAAKKEQSAFMRNIIQLISADGSKQPLIFMPGDKGTFSPVLTEAGDHIIMKAEIPTLPEGTLILPSIKKLMERETLSSTVSPLFKHIENGLPIAPKFKVTCKIEKNIASPPAFTLSNFTFSSDLCTSNSFEVTWFKDGKEVSTNRLTINGVGDIAGACLPIKLHLNEEEWFKQFTDLHISLPDLMNSGKPVPETVQSPLLQIDAEHEVDEREGYNYHDKQDAVEKFLVENVWKDLLSKTSIGQSEVFPTILRYGIDVVGLQKTKSQILPQENGFCVVVGLEEYENLYQRDLESAPQMIGGPLPPDTSVPALLALKIVELVTQVPFYAKSSTATLSKQEEALAVAEGQKKAKEALKEFRTLPDTNRLMLKDIPD